MTEELYLKLGNCETLNLYIFLVQINNNQKQCILRPPVLNEHIMRV